MLLLLIIGGGSCRFMWFSIGRINGFESESFVVSYIVCVIFYALPGDTPAIEGIEGEAPATLKFISVVSVSNYD